MKELINTAVAEDMHMDGQADIARVQADILCVHADTSCEQVDALNDDHNAAQTDVKPQPILRPGEIGFTAFILIASAFFVYRSILLYIDKPGLDGPAIVPLISSGAVVLLALAEAMRLLRASARGVKCDGLKAAAKLVRQYLLPINVVAALVAIVAYCALIKLGVSFYLATPVFLWGLMTFFARGGYLKNLLWTALCMAFIYTVFNLLLGVMIP